MSNTDSEFVDSAHLRIGLFVELDVGWLAHPFPTASFKIGSQKQIDTIRSLGLKRVRVVPSKSDPVVDEAAEPVCTPEQAQQAERLLAAQREQQLQRRHLEALHSQQDYQVACERRFGETVGQFHRAMELVASNPKAAAQDCQTMVNAIVGDMLAEGESAIRLLSEAHGDKTSLHAVNVSVISLLLGKAIGLSRQELSDLGMAAFLHDIGKTNLPDRVRWLDEGFSTVEYKLYQDHVALGVQTGRAMGLSNAILAAIEQHHELADGSGFPARLKGDSTTAAARILALVNRYDNLCNPFRPNAALTPHEALSLIFAQQKARFDNATLSAFIRMMGVYPPGSVVQLIDERYAMVVSVNSLRPLKPRVIVHEPGVPRMDALILDLEKTPHMGVRRSIKPSKLPDAAMQYLAPRSRVNYYFETTPEKAQDA